MLWSSRDRAVVRTAMEDARASYEEHAVYFRYLLSWTDCALCGYDPFTRSALDPDCPTCGGVGRVKTYATHRVYCRVTHPSLSDFVLGMAGGVSVGDAILFIDQRDKLLADKVRLDGYITIDNERYAISAIDPTGVGGSQEWAIKIERQAQ